MHVAGFLVGGESIMLDKGLPCFTVLWVFRYAVVRIVSVSLIVV